MTIDDQVKVIADASSAAAVAAHVKALHPTVTPPPGGGGTPPPASNTTPPPEAVVGLSARYSWEFSDNPSNSGWYVYDNSSGPNGELGYNTPRNVEIVSHPDPTQGAFMRMWAKREAYAGRAFTSVMMENSGVRFGAGKPFALEARMRWQSYPGYWGGLWAYQYPGNPAEIDVNETVNLLGPTCTTHSPNNQTVPLLPTNDGAWHHYIVRADKTGLYWWVDSVGRRQIIDPGVGAAFIAATMFPKLQHLVGGSWPDSDAKANGLPTPVPGPGVQFPFYCDVDFTRVWVP